MRNCPHRPPRASEKCVLPTATGLKRIRYWGERYAQLPDPAWMAAPMPTVAVPNCAASLGPNLDAVLASVETPAAAGPTPGSIIASGKTAPRNPIKPAPALGLVHGGLGLI